MRRFATITLALVLATTSAYAQTAPKPEHKLVFLSEGAIAPALLLPAPIKPDSAEGKAELDLVRATVKAATPAEIRAAAVDDGDEAVTLFATVIPGFDLAKLPATAKLFKDVENDQEIVTKVAKTHFARVRPFDLDHSISTCVPSTFGKAPTSYPSGHSTLGFNDGIILAHLMPERAETILDRARAYANNRVVCGVHFPSDTVASQSLASAMATSLMQSPHFQTEFATAKAELVAAGLTK